MSQAGYTPIQLYYSTTAAAVPVNTNLADGELAINITDGKLYYKDNGGTVRLLASNATSAPVLSFSAGTTGFTPSTATTGAVTLAGTLATTNGGTGLTSFTSGGVVYASSTSALATGSILSFDGTNLGVGTTSPATKLVLAGNNSALTENNTLRFWDTDTGTEANQQIGKIEFFSSDASTPGASVKAYIGAFAEDTTPDAYLAFATDGSTGTATERMRIDSSGNVGIGTSSPNAKLTIGDGSATYKNSSASASTVRELFNYVSTTPSVATANGLSVGFRSSDGFPNRGASVRMLQTGNSDSGGDASSIVSFWTYSNGNDNGAERVRIDKDGLVGINTTTPSGYLDIQGTQTYSILATRFGGSAGNSAFRSARGTQASPTVIANGDTIHQLAWQGYDGVSAYQNAAQIKGVIDGATISASSMPGALYFGTTPSGSVTITERLRITSAGAWGLSGANYGTSGQVLTSGGSGAAPTWTTVSGGGSVAGSDTQIQYNNSGAFGASSLFTFNKSTTAPMVEIGGASGVTSTSFRLRAPSATNGPYVGFSLANADAAVFWTWDTIGAIPLRFVAGGSELARFSTGGNLLINTTSDNGNKLQVNGGINLVNASNGISCHNYTTVTNGAIAFYNAYNNSDPRITFWGGTGSNLTYHTANLALYPGTDGGLTLGLSSNRWGQIYSTSGSINTSDAREKEQVEALTEAELRVAKKLKTLIRKFKWIDAVQKKGDSARIHVGVMAQDVQVAFEEEGLDASRYGLFCYDAVWVKIEEKEDLKTGGKVISKNPCLETDEGAICETRYGIRYDELLAFIIAAL
jgi:hypothetical protein